MTTLVGGSCAGRDDEYRAATRSALQRPVDDAVVLSGHHGDGGAQALLERGDQVPERGHVVQGRHPGIPDRRLHPLHELPLCVPPHRRHLILFRPLAGPAAASLLSSRSTELAGGAVAPLHPLRVVQNALRFGNASTFEDHDQIVVAVCGTEDLVPAAAVHGNPPEMEGRCTNDRPTGHASSLARSSTGAGSDQGPTAARSCPSSGPSVSRRSLRGRWRCPRTGRAARRPAGRRPRHHTRRPCVRVAGQMVGQPGPCRTAHSYCPISESRMHPRSRAAPGP